MSLISRMNHKAKQQAAYEMACDLYRVMPGAPPVPMDDQVGWRWDKVDTNDHFAFCLTIAERIVRWSGREIVNPD